ncbi:MAG: hypothetical protein ACP5N1_00375 [Candidatus Woesearchaeota archaeon]
MIGVYKNKVLIIILVVILSVLSISLFFDKSNIFFDNIISANIVNTQVEILPAIPQDCSFQLYSGWNLVSFYCLGLYNERSLVLDSINSSYESIFEYDSTDINDPWKSYNPNLPSWAVQQITHMDRVSGYWVYVYNDVPFFYSGKSVDSTIVLYDGWNLVGYPSKTNRLINISLNGISFSKVAYYDASSNTWLTYYVSGPDTLEYFETNKGYWINVNSSAQWNISRN